MSIDDFARIATSLTPLTTGKFQSQTTIKKSSDNRGSSQNTIVKGFAANLSDNDDSMRTRGLGQALGNIGDTKNTLSKATGGLQNILGVLQEMRRANTQTSDKGISKSEGDGLDKQLDKLTEKINSIINNNATTDAINLLEGTFVTPPTQIGQKATDVLSTTNPNSQSSSDLAVSSGNTDVTSPSTAQISIEKIDNAISKINNSINSINRQQNNLTVNENNVLASIINTDSLQNKIMNKEMLTKQLEITKNDIVNNTAFVMETQANASPENVMQLL